EKRHQGLQAHSQRRHHLGVGRSGLPDHEGHHVQQLQVPVHEVAVEPGLPDQLQLLHRGLSEPVVTPGAFDRPDPDGSLSRGDPVRIPRAAVRRPMNATVTLLTSLSLAVAYGCGVRAIPLDSDATFAMHQENRTFVVDRPRSGTPAVVTAAEWGRLPGEPAWALRRNGPTRASFPIDRS